jgi:hypothetical protein
LQVSALKRFGESAAAFRIKVPAVPSDLESRESVKKCGFIRLSTSLNGRVKANKILHQNVWIADAVAAAASSTQPTKASAAA